MTEPLGPGLMSVREENTPSWQDMEGIDILMEAWMSWYTEWQQGHRGCGTALQGKGTLSGNSHFNSVGRPPWLPSGTTSFTVSQGIFWICKMLSWRDWNTLGIPLPYQPKTFWKVHQC